MHSYAELAKKTVEEFITTGTPPSLSGEAPPDMQQKAGVFVCLKSCGQLRGCVGTFLPATGSIYHEIMRNAVAAAVEDSRFQPVRPHELTGLSYTVDVLSPPEEVADLSELDPKKYGIIVAKGQKKGLLLPDLDGVDTVESQVRITKMKAGIDPQETDVEIYRFTVSRYK
jgi:hypothetical protein